LSTLTTLLSVFNYGSYRAFMNFSYVKLKAKVMNIWSIWRGLI